MTKEELQAISEMIAPFNSRLEKLVQKIEEVKLETGELKGEVKLVQQETGELKEEVKLVQQETSQLKEEIKLARRENNQTRSVIETQICHSIDLLVEGHKEILETLKQYIPTQKQLEQDHVRIYALEETVVEHTAQIEELQRKTG